MWVGRVCFGTVGVGTLTTHATASDPDTFLTEQIWGKEGARAESMQNVSTQRASSQYDLGSPKLCPRGKIPHALLITAAWSRVVLSLI